MAKQTSVKKSPKTSHPASKSGTFWLDMAVLDLRSSKPTSSVTSTQTGTDFQPEINSFLEYYRTIRQQITAPVSFLLVLHFADSPVNLAQRLATLVERMPTNQNGSILFDYSEEEHSYLFCIDLLKCGTFLKMREISYDNLLEAFNSLKLPDVSKFAGEISSTKRNELIEAGIKTTKNSLPKIMDWLVEQYLATKSQITEEQATTLLKHAPTRVRHNVVKSITPELFPDLTSSNIKPIVPTEIKSFSDLRAIELDWYRQLVFQDKEPTLPRFQKWVASLNKSKLSSPIEKDGLLKALRHYCDEFGVDVTYQGEACYISINTANNSSGVYRLLSKIPKKQVYSDSDFPNIEIS